MSTTQKPVNQKAWFLILPVLVCVAFSAIVPLMTVVNYSVQDIISPERRVFVGTEWFAQVMRDSDLHEALLRQITFSLAVLLVEIPLGILLALSMPASGEFKLGVRPEYVAITASGTPGALPVEVTQSQDIGTYWLITAKHGDSLVRARLSAELKAPQVGDHVWLSVLGSHTCFYDNEELVA